MNKPLVSVSMITYGHEALIEEAILSVLMQECDFEVELIIADDCSPDHTKRVVDKLIKTHPNGHWIKYTKHEKNLGIAANLAWSLQQGRGEYLAICEGDDFWIDPKKLQKQVDFLSNNSDYSLCCHSTNEINEQGEIFKVASRSEELVTLSMVLEEGWFIRTASMVFRSNALDGGFPTFYYTAYSTDYIIQVMILKAGMCKYLPDVMSTYRHHSGGVSKSNRVVTVERWIKKVNLLDDLNLFTNKQYSNEIAAQQKTIKSAISFYFALYPFLIKQIGFSTFREYFKISLFFSEAISWLFNRLRV